MVAHRLGDGYYGSYHDSGLLVTVDRDVSTNKRPAVGIRIGQQAKRFIFRSPHSKFNNDMDLT